MDPSEFRALQLLPYEDKGSISRWVAEGPFLLPIAFYSHLFSISILE